MKKLLISGLMLITNYTYAADISKNYEATEETKDIKSLLTKWSQIENKELDFQACNIKITDYEDFNWMAKQKKFNDLESAVKRLNYILKIETEDRVSPYFFEVGKEKITVTNIENECKGEKENKENED